MNAQLATMFWCAATVLIVSRIGLLVFSKLGDNTGRLLLVHGLSYTLAALFVPQAYDGGTPNYARSFEVYFVPALIWLMVDLARMAHRRSRAISAS